MKDKCMEELNELFAANRAVLAIPLGTWKTRFGKLTDVEVAQIKGAVDNALRTTQVELRKKYPEIHSILSNRLNEIVEVGDKVSWEMGAEDDFQATIDDAMCFMEEALLDAACRCECGRRA